LALMQVLFRTFVSMKHDTFGTDSIVTFFFTFFQSLIGSVLLGTAIGCISALVFKWSSLHKYPSLEMSLVFIFAYFPYLLAEGCNLSGITAILFTGIVMAHYTHKNLSSLSQVRPMTALYSRATLNVT
jgi:NhaP-type Na+/H+ or K+/H+ antiporter